MLSLYMELSTSGKNPLDQIKRPWHNHARKSTFYSPAVQTAEVCFSSYRIDVFYIVVDVARLEPWCPMSIQLTAECEVVGMRTSTKAMGLSARKGWNAHSWLIKVAPPSGWFKYLRVCPQVERKINNHSNFVHVAQLQSTS